MAKIICWNVNSIRARLEHLNLLIINEKPDIILLQEIKCVENDFPISEFSDLGYNCAIHGQKSYNGVAILSRYPIEDVIKDFKNKTNDSIEARFIECVIPLDNIVLRVASIYVPNGSPNGIEAKMGNLELTETSRFKYKMSFLYDLRMHLQECLKYNEISIFGGDLNIAPLDLDVYSVKNWTGQICFLPEEKEQFQEILDSGYYDIMRQLYPNDQLFTWYDYRRGMFNYGKGIRIDHFLCSKLNIHYIKNVSVLNYYRGLDKPSDHVPIAIDILDTIPK